MGTRMMVFTLRIRILRLSFFVSHSSLDVSSKRQRLIHPVVALEDLFAVEAGEALGAVLGEADELPRADRAPGVAQVGGVAEEDVVFGAGEHLGAAGIALAGGAAEKLAVDAERAVRLRAD